MSNNVDIPKDHKKRIAKTTCNLFHRVFKSLFGQHERLDTLSWSQKYRVLGSSAAESGRYNCDRTPYMKGIYAALDSTDPSEQVILLKKGAQLGATEAAANWIGRHIHQNPQNILMFQDTEKKAAGFIEEKIIPMLRSSAFRGIIDTSGIRKKGITYGDCSLKHAGGQSTAGFSSHSAPVVILDEYCRYKSNVGSADKGEGDALSLAIARTATFGARAKVYVPSTPVENSYEPGSFTTLYERGDQRKFHVPCPKCGDMDFMSKDRFRIVGTGLNIDGQMLCKKCGELSTELEYKSIYHKGEWRPTSERLAPNITSFHLPGLLSPLGWKSWKSIALDWNAAKEGKAEMRPVMNLYFGEEYNEEVDVPLDTDIIERHSGYGIRGTVHKDVGFLTMGVDIQRGWVVWEIKGWGKKGISYSLDTGKINHDIETVACRHRR